MKKILIRLAGILLAVARGTRGFLTEAAGLLASSARTTPADDELNNAVRGGVFNHRTGKFDEGNDPAGWYERD